MKSAYICKFPSLSFKQEIRIIQMCIIQLGFVLLKKHFNYCAWLIPVYLQSLPKSPVLYSGLLCSDLEVKSNDGRWKANVCSWNWCITHLGREVECLSPLPAGRREITQKEEKGEAWRGRKKHLHSEDSKCYKRSHLIDFLLDKKEAKAGKKRKWFLFTLILRKVQVWTRTRYPSSEQS